MRTILCTLCLLALLTVAPVARAQTTQPQAGPPFELLDGDRVVFVGGTFFDREGRLGYIETALTSRFPGRSLTFRNLGYAGDTVRCEGRTVCEGWANFGPPDEGFQKLKKLVAEIKPTVVFVAYGMGESFEGEQKLPQFVADYNKLLDMLAEASGGKPRFVLIGPNYHEDLGRPLPDPAEHNKQLKAYTDAIERIANERAARYVDLFAATKQGIGPATGGREVTEAEKFRLTDNGIQLTPQGYWNCAVFIEKALGYPVRSSQLVLDAGGRVIKSAGLKVGEVKAAPSLSFSATEDLLPWAYRLPVYPPDKSASFSTGVVEGPSMIHVNGLPDGSYALKVAGKSVGEGDSKQWAAGRVVEEPGYEQAEKLRELIVAKNADYFNYWRHENDTYILGYRKHEQGKNAVELPQFIPLAEEKDKEIDKLKVPQPVTYTLEKAAK